MHNKTIGQQNGSSNIWAAPTVYHCNKHLKQQLPKASQNIFKTVTTTDLPGITEWLLASNICQTHIYGENIGKQYMCCTLKKPSQIT